MISANSDLAAMVQLPLSFKKDTDVPEMPLQQAAFNSFRPAWYLVILVPTFHMTNLFGQQQMFTGLWHSAVCSRYNQNSTIHNGSSNNHVLKKNKRPMDLDALLENQHAIGQSSAVAHILSLYPRGSKLSLFLLYGHSFRANFNKRPMGFGALLNNQLGHGPKFQK